MAGVSSRLMKAKLDSVNLTYYMAPPSALFTLPWMLSFEWSLLGERWASDFANTPILLVLFVSGVIALGLNLSTFLVIKNTSALTYTVIGNVKVIFSIVISVLLFRNEVGPLNAIGCAITIGGAWWYSQIQYEVRQRKADLPVTNQGIVETKNTAN